MNAGTFRDVTTYMGAGSYRVRGPSGGLSEFLILLDLRPVNQVITGKLNYLEQVLDNWAASMPAPLYADLSARLDTIRADFGRGATTTAIQGVDGFLAVVEQHAGTLPQRVEGGVDPAEMPEEGGVHGGACHP